MDTLTRRQRSRLMSRIRSSGSRPERLVRGILRELISHRLRYNVRSLPGTPDIVARPLRLAVFVDGCFWHSCPLHGRVPRTRRRFWTEKLLRNAERDRESRTALEAAGWTVLRVWEHETRAVPALRSSLRKAVNLLSKA